MISFIEGKIEYLGDSYVILSAGGIGYRVYIAPKLTIILSKAQGDVKLFIYPQLNMREGSFSFYGFQEKKDLDIFELLTSVSGIGPKNAMNIISAVDPAHLKAAVVKEDANYLLKVSGLGPKTAKRLVLELKNKIEDLDIGDAGDIDLGQEGQAAEALMSLGYSMAQVKEALKEVSPKAKDLQERVREALKILGKR